jgi:hypothetical protein
MTTDTKRHRETAVLEPEPVAKDRAAHHHSCLPHRPTRPRPPTGPNVEDTHNNRSTARCADVDNGGPTGATRPASHRHTLPRTTIRGHRTGRWPANDAKTEPPPHGAGCSDPNTTTNSTCTQPCAMHAIPMPLEPSRLASRMQTRG